MSLSIAIQRISTISFHPGRHGEHVRADRRRYRPSKFVGFAFTRIAGVTIPGHFCNRLSPAASFPFTGYSRPTSLLPASRARPFQAAFHKPTKLPDANSLLVSAAYEAGPSRRPLQPAAAESPTPLWHCSNRIQDRTHLGARRLEAARGVHDKIRPVALLVIRSPIETVPRIQLTFRQWRRWRCESYTGFERTNP